MSNNSEPRKEYKIEKPVQPNEKKGHSTSSAPAKPQSTPPPPPNPKKS